MVGAPPGEAEAEHWAAVVSSVYGLDVLLEPLDGEFDLNYRAHRDGAAAYVLKVMRPGCERALVDLQCAALDHLARRAPDLPVPNVIETLNGGPFETVADAAGDPRLVWMIAHLDGEPYATFRPRTPALGGELDRCIGRMDAALSDFSHPALDRDIKWDLTQAEWIGAHLDLIDGVARRRIVENIYRCFADYLKPALADRRLVPIHNDLNDYNVLVATDGYGGDHVSGLIDFGDMLAAPQVCELAIAGAYALLDIDKPLEMLAALVGGYHEERPLTDDDVAQIYPLILTRLAVSVVNAAVMKQEKPGDPYVTISEAPAWRFLDLSASVDPAAMAARLRIACGKSVTPSADRTLAWLDQNRGRFEPVLGRDLGDAPVIPLSVSGSTLPRNPLHLEPAESEALSGAGGDADWRVGCYAEPRLIYTAEIFRDGPFQADDQRTVHLGVDIFAPAGAIVRAPMHGIVHAVGNAPERFDYGGVAILAHETPDGDPFWTLYGHLNPAVAETLRPGMEITAGTAFAALGNAEENGGWEPHLHFQLAMTTVGLGDFWPGVSDPDDLAFQVAVCPNPAALLNLDDTAVQYQPLPTADIAAARRDRFAANLKLSYTRPCLFLRGWRHYLFDEMGRPYIDAYNNVPHVGHAHPRIQAVAAEQLRRLNSNSRYLHPAHTAFAETILEKLPDRFSVCFFVNSGSEANELALRLARAHTGGKDMITPDHGYHGMTTGAIDISAYKFNRPGGVGKPDWVQLLSLPDTYRGRYREDDPAAGEKYAAEVDGAIAKIDARGGKLAGFIAETFPSVGGQIIPPPGYLNGVYAKVRGAGGVCIADEVQTGLGRLGSHYWAFDVMGAEPDIVVLGKPLGNGHPLGATITTRDIADSFANGIEFFSTFGGSTLSCVTGREVLRIVDDEDLQDNARVVGSALIDGFRSLMARHPVIGDVRGHGLFLGIELVRDRDSRTPAGDIADYVANRLRDHRILVGIEGPNENVLKIRPPLTVDIDAAEMILDRLERRANRVSRIGDSLVE